GTLLLLGPVDDDALRADADIGAEAGAEHRRSLSQLEGDAHLFRHAQPESAILDGDRESEQAERPHFRDDLIGYGVGVGDAMLVGHEPLAHEAPNGGEQLVEGFGVESHPSTSMGVGAGRHLTGAAVDVANAGALCQVTAMLDPAASLPVRIQRVGTVAIVTIDNPPVNALSQAVRR